MSGTTPPGFASLRCLKRPFLTRKICFPFQASKTAKLGCNGINGDVKYMLTFRAVNDDSFLMIRYV